MKIQTIIVVIITFFFSNCEKHGSIENNNPIDTVSNNIPNDSLDIEPISTYDTIFPKSYLPAYPGSYWIYNNGDTIKTNSGYILSTTKRPYYNENTFILYDCIPIDTAFFPIYNYEILNEYTTYSTSSEWCSENRLLDEAEGSSWSVDSHKDWYSYLIVQKKDTSIILPNNQEFDSVIIMNFRRFEGNYDLAKIEYYYAKNVGYLGSKTIYDLPMNIDSIKWNLYLTDYLIMK